MNKVEINQAVPVNLNGEVEIIVKDRNGNILSQERDKNLVKAFAKEIIAHRIASTKVWDPTAGSGAGAWVSSGIDTNEELSLKYILFGASFDTNGAPLDSADTRYYTNDPNVGYIPIRLTPGASYNGGLINAVPIAEPSRPLKKIERIYFEPTYQPSGSPYLNDDVRAVNNILVVETILRLDEYNGLTTTDGDYLTITEVALAAGEELEDNIGACECDPTDVFLKGHSDGTPLLGLLAGSDIITLDASEASYVDLIKEGDQIKLVSYGTGTDYSTLDQITPFYLVTNKSVGGFSITLDRTPQDASGNIITGQVGVFKDGLKIFAHKILSAPVRKSAAVEITVRWRLILG